LDPVELLTRLKFAERELGRKESPVKWGPRVIDLDILLYGKMVIETVELTIPHAHLISRPFVMNQLLELDADLMHPKLRVPIRSFLKK
jgi:2-amino-4-hydroxy-6-hydroxymethyldihydropteridine diphosphokinase